jgi:hypothetical protein
MNVQHERDLALFRIVVVAVRYRRELYGYAFEVA